MPPFIPTSHIVAYDRLTRRNILNMVISQVKALRNKRRNGYWTSTVVKSRKAATVVQSAYKAKFDISQTEVPWQNRLSLITD